MYQFEVFIYLYMNSRKLNDEEESNTKFGVNEANDAGGHGQRIRQRPHRSQTGMYRFFTKLSIDNNLCS